MTPERGLGRPRDGPRGIAQLGTDRGTKAKTAGESEAGMAAVQPRRAL